MAENTPYSNLKEAIRILEKEQAVSGQLLKDQFKSTYESLNPFNLIKSSFGNFIESPEIRTDLLGLLMSMVTGVFVKKVSAGSRHGNMLKQAGILLLDSLGRYIINNPEVLNTVGSVVVNIFHKNKTKDKTAE